MMVRNERRHRDIIYDIFICLCHDKINNMVKSVGDIIDMLGEVRWIKELTNLYYISTLTSACE